MSNNLNLGISVIILILFFIIIAIGFVYVQESRDNVIAMNATLQSFTKTLQHKQEVDNVRFNETLGGLQRLGIKIINLTNLQIDLTDLQNNNTARNLNLTKYNRAMLSDSNHILREMVKQLNITGIEPFNGSRFH